MLDRPVVYSAKADTGKTTVQGPCGHFFRLERVVAPTWEEAGDVGRCHLTSAVYAIRAVDARCSQIRYRTVLEPGAKVFPHTVCRTKDLMGRWDRVVSILFLQLDNCLVGL